MSLESLCDREHKDVDESGHRDDSDDEVQKISDMSDMEYEDGDEGLKGVKGVPPLIASVSAFIFSILSLICRKVFPWGKFSP